MNENKVGQKDILQLMFNLMKSWYQSIPVKFGKMSLLEGLFGDVTEEGTGCKPISRQVKCQKQAHT